MKGLSVWFCTIIGILIALSACAAAVFPHQTYTYSSFPSPPYATSHFDTTCQSSVHRLYRGENVLLTWTAAPVIISGTPVVSYAASPVSIRIRTVLIGPYKTCGTFHDAVQGGTVKGHVALELPILSTDTWHATTFHQRLSLPLTDGYYVLFEQRWQSRSEVSKIPSSDQYISWIHIVSREGTGMSKDVRSVEGHRV